MNVEEILADLPKLSRPELEQVDTRLHELLGPSDNAGSRAWGEALLELAGTAQNLPADYAHQHDHYLHGADRR